VFYVTVCWEKNMTLQPPCENSFRKARDAGSTQDPNHLVKSNTVAPDPRPGPKQSTRR
jgi:hypothetical protein